MALERVAPLEGTFITARIAAHAAQGVGPFFNRPSLAPQPPRPIESPLALALVTAEAWAGLPPLEGARATALLAELAALALLLGLLREQPLTAALSALLIAAAPELARDVAGGGTGSLALLLLLMTCVAAREHRPLLVGVLGALAASASPMAIFVLPALWLIHPQRPSAMLASIGGFVAVSGLASWALYALTGDWRPTPLVRGGLRLGPGTLGPGAWVVFGGTALAGLRRGSFARLAEARPLVLAGLLALLPWLVLGRSLELRAAYLPLAASLPLAAAAVADLLSPRFTPRCLPTGIGARSVASILGLGLVVGGVLTLPRRRASLRQGLWEPLRAWSERAGVSAGEGEILAKDLGWVGWYSGGVVREAAPRPLGLIAQLAVLQPEYLLLPAAQSPLATLRSSGDLARAWYPIERFSLDGRTRLDPELEGLPERTDGDFILFQRRL